MPEHLDLHGMAPHTCPVALLLIDVLNDLEWPDAELMEPHARRMAKAVAKLKDEAKKRGVPVVYVNDNFGQWRSDLNSLVDHLLKDKVRGQFLGKQLKPEKDDYFVLKPKHSAFFGTTLDILLNYLGVKTVILAGLAGNICVLFTANDAYMRDLKVVVPRDCIASNRPAENKQALEIMRTILKAETPLSREVPWQKLIDGRDVPFPGQPQPLPADTRAVTTD